jgi:hypothetical protein
MKGVPNVIDDMIYKRVDVPVDSENIVFGQEVGDGIVFSFAL